MSQSKIKKSQGSKYQPSNPEHSQQIDRLGSGQSFNRDETIFGIGQAARHIFKVEEGCVRTFVHKGESHRLIVGLYFPGDYFGLELDHTYNVSAAAVVSSGILAIERRILSARAPSNFGVSKAMLDITNVELQRAQQHALLLRIPTASDRVAQFLLDMKARKRGKVVELAMSRQDMADYLNLTIESVARALTKLKDESSISMQTPRRIAVHIRGPKAVAPPIFTSVV